LSMAQFCVIRYGLSVIGKKRIVLNTCSLNYE